MFGSSGTLLVELLAYVAFRRMVLIWVDIRFKHKLFARQFMRSYFGTRDWNLPFLPFFFRVLGFNFTPEFPFFKGSDQLIIAWRKFAKLFIFLSSVGSLDFCFFGKVPNFCLVREHVCQCGAGLHSHLISSNLGRHYLLGLNEVANDRGRSIFAPLWCQVSLLISQGWSSNEFLLAWIRVV